MDLTLRNVTLPDAPGAPVDIGIKDGKIVALQSGLSPAAEDLDLGGRLVVPGFVETHIHLDKACILDRCASKKGDLDEAISQVAAAKKAFTADDVAARAARTLRKCIVNGTTRMRTHVELDPVIGLRGLDGVKAAIAEHAWAIDVELCVFPQEGLLNYPGTAELLVEALRGGASVLGGAPYTDSDPHGQIDWIFATAREFDVDIDMHLDFSLDPSDLDVDYVCRKTDEFGWGGRVAVGHVSKLSALPPAELAAVATRMANAGVAATVLPSTDLFLMAREHDHKIPRGVMPVHKMLEHGVNCSISTNNVLNPFTPFGDGSMIRMANLYANAGQIGTRDGMAACLDMVTARPARLLNHDDYGIRVGAPADVVVLDNVDAAMAVAELAPPLYGFKKGRRTFTRAAPVLHAPD